MPATPVSTDQSQTETTSTSAATATTAAEERQQAWRAAMRGCDRFLLGHGPLRLRESLAALAEDVTDDDEPDTYGKGKLIEQFEREIAGLLGKEAAVFLPSGTMAQQIALRIWSDRSGRKTVAFHPTCHLEIHEFKGYELLHGLHGRLVGDANQLITLDDLRAVPEPLAALLLELPQREIGGQLPEWPDVQAQVAWARERGAAVHMDGARLWEAAPYYGRTYAEVAALFDSVYVSFYKGIGAIAGAALAGPAEFVAEARIWQRRHGGNLVHLYPYVLSARAGLEKRLAHFPSYYRRAVEVARALHTVPGVIIKPERPQTHMMHVYLPGDREQMLAESLRIAQEEHVALISWLRPTDIPGYTMFELTVGDAARALRDDEIAAWFARIVAAGQAEV